MKQSRRPPIGRRTGFTHVTTSRQESTATARTIRRMEANKAARTKAAAKQTEKGKAGKGKAAKGKIEKAAADQGRGDVAPRTSADTKKTGDSTAAARPTDAAQDLRSTESPSTRVSATVEVNERLARARERRRETEESASIVVLHHRPGRDALGYTGPLVPGWLLPFEEGHDEAAVRGVFLIDTGARKSCVGLGAAKRLGLEVSSTAPTRGAGGLYESARYRARFRLEAPEPLGAVERAVLAIGVPGLAAGSQGIDIRVDDEEVALIGLIGCDLLDGSRLLYDGRAGEFHFELRYGPDGPWRPVEGRIRDD